LQPDIVSRASAS